MMMVMIMVHHLLEILEKRSFAHLAQTKKQDEFLGVTSEVSQDFLRRLQATQKNAESLAQGYLSGIAKKRLRMLKRQIEEKRMQVQGDQYSEPDENATRRGSTSRESTIMLSSRHST